APPAPVAAPPSTPASSGPPPPTLENSRDAITAVVAAYATAIGSRDLAEIRRVYPRITADQQGNWKAFFGAIRSIVAKLDITSLEVTGTTALAQLSGVYEYVNSAGRVERQRVIVHATLQRDADDWKIVSIR